MFDASEIRKDFPILQRKVNGHDIIYFDNAATSQKPLQVIEAVKEFYERHNANVHRGVHTLSQESSKLYEEAHEETARLVNARGIEEIVFVKNATEAINLVAYSLALHMLGEGDEVITTVMEHHSNIVPWEMLSKIRGFKVKYADVKGDGTLDFESLEGLITERTKIVTVTHASNVTGVINDIAKISKLAHQNNAILVVDGAQSVPHMPVDVRKLDIDFLAFSGHKMLAPTGIGVLYGKRELLEKMEPFIGGGDMIRSVKYDKLKGCSIEWHHLPWKFEAGTPNVCNAIGLAEAIRYLKRLGMENVREHERQLTQHTLKLLQENESVEAYGPRDVSTKCGIVSFNVRGLNHHDVALIFDSFGIMVRSGYHCAEPLHHRLGVEGSVRASFYIYNTMDEVERFIEVLREIRDVR